MSVVRLASDFEKANHFPSGDHSGAEMFPKRDESISTICLLLTLTLRSLLSDEVNAISFESGDQL